MNVCPAIVIVPIRGVVLVLPGTVYWTLPLPVPLLPEVIVMKGSLLTAIHEQSVPVTLTLTFFDPPLARRLTSVAPSVYVQGPEPPSPPPTASLNTVPPPLVPMPG